MKNNQLANFEGMRNFMIEMKSLIMEAILAGNESNDERLSRIQEEIATVQEAVENLKAKWDAQQHNENNASMDEGDNLQP